MIAHCGMHAERDAQAVVLKQQIVQARGNLVRGSQRLCEVLDYMAWKLKQLENQLKQLSLTGELPSYNDKVEELLLCLLGIPMQL